MLLPRPGDIYIDQANNYTIRIISSDEITIRYERSDGIGIFSMPTADFEKEFSFLRSE